MNEQNQNAEQPKDSADPLGKAADALIKIIDGSHKVAKEGPTITLLVCGMTLLIVAVAGVFIPAVSLRTTEFVALLSVGSLLLIAGAVMRLCVYRTEVQVDKEIRQQSLETIRIQQTASNHILQKQQDTASTGSVVRTSPGGT